MTDSEFQQIAAAESERIAALRMQLLEMHPFWGYILLQMRLIAAPELPTAAMTDRIGRIWFNPRLTRELDTRELGFVLMHEICHQVLAADDRRRNREPHKWDMATDYAVNDLIAGIPAPGTGYYGAPSSLYRLPPGWLFSSRYKGWVAETIYEDLCRRKVEPDVEFFDLTLPDGDGGALELPDVPGLGGGIDLHMPLEPDEEQRELLKTRLAAAADNFHANHDRGNIPNDLLRRLGLLTPPKQPWRRLLHQYADGVLHRDEYSLAFPNRRFLLDDLVVPGYYNETIGMLVAAVDSSGSMTDADIRAVLSELRGMVDQAQEMIVIVADCKIQEVVEGEDLDAFFERRRVRGGGGTDHNCVFDYIAEHGIAPAVFVGLSDLYSSFPERRPSYPVLWLVPEHHGTPPWGRVIEM